MKYSGYWLSIVETNLDNHVLHTFLSCYLSFPSLSSVTSFITPTNDGPVLMDFTLGRPEQFQNYTWRRMFLQKLSPPTDPTVNIIVYNSLFKRCNRHRQLTWIATYHLTPWHLNPVAGIDSTHNWHDKLGWPVIGKLRNEASLNPAIYWRCFTSNGVSIIGVFIEKHCLNCRAPLLPFWNFKCGSCELLYSNKFHKYSLAWYVL